MFDFLIEIHPYDLENGIDGLSTANITINGEYGSLTSKRDKPPYQDMMIFISITNLLYKIIKLIKNEIKEYNFVGIDCSFQFYILNKNNTFILTDSKMNTITEATSKELVISIGNGVDSFMSKYRCYLKKNDGVTIDLDNSIKEFKNQFSDIIDSSKER